MVGKQKCADLKLHCTQYLLVLNIEKCEKGEGGGGCEIQLRASMFVNFHVSIHHNLFKKER